MYNACLKSEKVFALSVSKSGPLELKKIKQGILIPYETEIQMQMLPYQDLLKELLKSTI